MARSHPGANSSTDPIPEISNTIRAGGVDQVVERLLSMWEVPNSIPSSVKNKNKK
jgi:hypothetical protein